jgi:DNA-binding GntR family transcriptional regulator
MDTLVRSSSLQSPALSEIAARALRELILDGRLLPGARLVERDLAEALHVSRVPVREALRQLMREGLVSVVPHRGAVVSPVSASLVIDVFSVRVVLESMAARIAAPQLSDETLLLLTQIVTEMEGAGRHSADRRLVDQDLAFHRTLAAACNRTVLLEALDAIWNRTSLLISASRPAYPLERIGELHRPILEAVAARDADRVEAAVKAHLAFGESVLLQHLMAVEGGQMDQQVVETPSLLSSHLPIVNRAVVQTGDEVGSREAALMRRWSGS